jgi:antitoxin component of RelBE/YafQ-DinJ toxin-antitoxin module/DNA-directed RNA polymerase subunit F
MPSLDMSQPLVKAGAFASNDWGSVDADTEVKIIGNAQLKRGINAGIGIGAFANANAGLSKFIAAQIGGTAFARAQVRLCAHTPLNLFDKCGVEAAVEAIAEAAAGVSVNIGLSVGDIIKLFKEVVGDQGLPIDLIVMLLEETEVSIKAQARAAAAAKAHAAISLLVMLTGNDPSFKIRGEAGVGLAAGAGFGFQAGFKFVNFRRYWARSIDKSINRTVGSIKAQVPAAQADLHNLLSVMAPVSKTLLRIAYEVADMLAREGQVSPGNNENVVAQKVVQIIIEEFQRFLFQTITNSAIKSLLAYFDKDSSFKNSSWWSSSSSSINTINHAISGYPVDPYLEDDDNVLAVLLNSLSQLFSKIPEDGSTRELKREIASLFSVTLLTQYMVAKKLVKSETYAMAVGAGTARTPLKAGFIGQVAISIDPSLVAYINTQIQRPVSSKLDYSNLISYLITGNVIDPLVEANPVLVELSKIFESEFGTPKRMISMFLESGSTIAFENKASEQEVMKVMLTAFEKFIDRRIKVDVISKVQPYLSDETSRLLFEEVMVGTALYMKSEIFSALLNWKSIRFTREEILESLSGVVMILLGRTFAVTGDVLFNAIMHEISKQLVVFAKDVQPGGKLIRSLRLQENVVVAKTLQIGLEVASAALQPIDAPRRKRMRNYLFNILQPIPLSDRSDFLKSLQRDNFIPDPASVNGLTDELKGLLIERLGKFFEAFIQVSSDIINDVIEELLDKASELIDAWKNKMEDVLQELVDIARRIENEVRVLQEKVDNAMNGALDEATKLLRSVKNGCFDLARKALVDAFYDHLRDWANDIKVEDNLWTPLINEGQVFRDARNTLLNSAKGTIKTALGSLRAIESCFDDILDVGDDVKARLRRIDMKRNISEQVSTILVDVISDKLKDKLGRNFSLQVELGFFGFKKKIGLSQDDVVKEIKNAIKSWSTFTEGVHDIAAKFQQVAQDLVQLGLKQETGSQATAYKGSVEKIRSNQRTGDSKFINIVTPVRGELYERPFQSVIHLSGISESYLGLLKNEQQRVFIHLNGKLLRMNDSTVKVRVDIISHTPTNQAINEKLRTRVLAAADANLSGPGMPATFEARIEGRTAVTVSQISNLILEFSVSRDIIKSGINTLSISIEEPGGKSVNKNTYFLYNPNPGKDQRSENFTPDIAALRANVDADKLYVTAEANKHFKDRLKF